MHQEFYDNWLLCNSPISLDFQGAGSVFGQPLTDEETKYLQNRNDLLKVIGYQKPSVKVNFWLQCISNIQLGLFNFDYIRIFK